MNHKEDEILCRLVVLLGLLLSTLSASAHIYSSFLDEVQNYQKRSKIAKQRKIRLQTTWEKENLRINDLMFYR